MNNNINTILEAVGELDNTVLENAFGKKRKKPALMIASAVAAAAVGTSLLAGASHVYRKPVFHKGEEVFAIVETTHPDAVILSIEELTEMGAYDFDPMSKNGEYTCFIKRGSTEMIERYNLPPLISDNFSDIVTPDDLPEDTELFYITYFNYEEDNQKVLPGTKVRVRDNCVSFYYFLLDKLNGVPVFVRVNYTIHTLYDFGFASFNGDDCRVIDLNSGEKAMISGSKDSTIAYFGYRGVDYWITGKTDVDGMNQVLRDLGITAEQEQKDPGFR